MIIGEVDAETNLDLQINDNLDGTSDISVNSDFDITDSKLKIKPELRISFKSEQNSVDEDFTCISQHQIKFTQIKPIVPIWGYIIGMNIS